MTDYLARREHMTDDYPCWCGPVYLRLCPECDGSEAGCWYCKHGYRPGLLMAAPYSDEGPFIVVHNKHPNE